MSGESKHWPAGGPDLQRDPRERRLNSNEVAGQTVQKAGGAGALFGAAADDALVWQLRIAKGHLGGGRRAAQDPNS